MNPGGSLRGSWNQTSQHRQQHRNNPKQRSSQRVYEPTTRKALAFVSSAAYSRGTQQADTGAEVGALLNRPTTGAELCSPPHTYSSYLVPQIISEPLSVYTLLQTQGSTPWVINRSSQGKLNFFV